MHFSQFNFKSQLLIISLSIFLLLPILNGQQIEHVGGKKYQYEGQVYKYGEMDHVFRQNEFSYHEFQKTISKRKTAKTLGYVSLGGLGVIIVGAAIFSNDGGDFSGLALAVLGGIPFIGAGTTALIVKSGSKRLEKRSVDIFNQQTLEVSEGNSTSMRAQMGLLSNGRVGIVFNF